MKSTLLMKGNAMLRTPRRLIPIFSCFLAALSLAASAVAQEQPQWIWNKKANGPETVEFRKSFSVEGKVKSAFLTATADNQFTIWLNGKIVLQGDNWQVLESAQVTDQLQPGQNILAVRGVNAEGIAGLLLALRITDEKDQATSLVSDASWKASTGTSGKWQAADFDDIAWKPAFVLGTVGDPKLPWSKSVTAKEVSEGLRDMTEATFVPVVAENVTPREGYVVEKIFDVPKAMGSWVSLTKDPRGRLIASAQGDEGLYLIEPGANGQPTHVQKLPVELSSAQGLCWAFDSLYAVVNAGGKSSNSGLHRLRDTNGDGLPDTDDYLMPLPGAGEHGPHAILPSPDGKTLHIIAGNHTKMPDGITGSRVPRNWGEDLLLPRRWDANGHAAGILAPAGWIMKIDPEAKQREVISIGYRNEYDIAFNADGELFAYDADMEWDLGSPWYRPTRVCHAVSGSEFGWRSGTGKWPAYYEDSLPSVVDIGPGSPVGVVFGAGTRFPEKYQRALFLLDWTFSTIYAVHLTPDGSTYSGVKEEFLTGQPMQVTDAVIADDGTLCFTCGGRGTASSMYRVRYTGNEPTDPVDLKDPAGVQERALRHQLEAFHGKPGGDLNLIFAHLGDEDRFIRYAARVALEWQPVESWRQRALTGENLSSRGRILAMIALARQGSPDDLPAILNVLTHLNFSELDEQSRLALLRTYELAFTRLGHPNEEWRGKVIATLDPLYPAPVYAVNAELVQLLVYLNAPHVVSKTLALMDSLGPDPLPDWGYLVDRNERFGATVGKLLENMPPARALHFAFVLRNQKEGWTLPERKKYFQFLIDASRRSGGNSYAKIISQFREDAFATCSPSEKIALGAIASQSLLAPPPQVTPPKGPGRKWTHDEVIEAVKGKLHRQNFARGRELFFATSCAKCHRLNGEGGSVGPDLATAGKKFPLPDLVDTLLEPSKVISDQYASHQVATTDGEIVQGRAVEIGDELYVFTPDADAPPKIFKKSQIEEVVPSKVSQMPVGLLDSLNPSELRDLMAYLISGADQKNDVYHK